MVTQGKEHIQISDIRNRDIQYYSLVFFHYAFSKENPSLTLFSSTISAIFEALIPHFFLSYT